MTKNPTNNLSHYVLLGAVLLVAISIFYYFVVFIPRKNNEEQIQKINNINSLNTCLDKAQTDYQLAWDKNCELLGKGKSCALASGVERLDNLKKEAKDECFRMYPEN